jgi:hypothetical protein
VRVRPREPAAITVLMRERTEEWEYTLEELDHRSFRLTLRSPNGRSWQASDWNVVDCLLQLRKQVEPLGVLLSCNGSRRDARCSHMARDMGGGFAVYLTEEDLDPAELTRDAEVTSPLMMFPTLGAASPDLIVPMRWQHADDLLSTWRLTRVWHVLWQINRGFSRRFRG